MTDVRHAWTPVEDDLLSRLVAERLSASAIARRLDRPESSVSRRIEVIGKRDTRIRRPCMCCSNEFVSEGPHNRLCTNCRKKETSPYQL